MGKSSKWTATIEEPSPRGAPAFAAIARSPPFLFPNQPSAQYRYSASTVQHFSSSEGFRTCLYYKNILLTPKRG